MTEGEKAIIERLDRLHALLLAAFGDAAPAKIEVRQWLTLEQALAPDRPRGNL